MMTTHTDRYGMEVKTMREIKFRGKRLDNGEWVYGYYFIEERDIEDGIIWRDIPQIQQRYGDHFQYFDVDLATVGQYTGLHDKNGREIYEGDIVRMHYFFENYHSFTLGAFEDEETIVCKLSITPLGVYFENNNMTGYLCDYLEDPSEELEVIGNIYENPELFGDSK
jgi:uncharacterized phage protein (TIGR01671 family)